MRMNKTDKMAGGLLLGLLCGLLVGLLLALVLIPIIQGTALPIMVGVICLIFMTAGGIIGAKNGKKMF